MALLSVTEGEDKPLKYPTLFNSADAAVITKIDLAEPCGFDRDLALRNINEIRPGIRIFETSAKTGAGMKEWLRYLAECRTGPELELEVEKLLAQSILVSLLRLFGSLPRLVLAVGGLLPFVNLGNRVVD